ncbi:hypothetical protein [Kineococcus esterisolvens]|uniref:hypothetical protein n=1 Tax=unclassified Kineococcus TaxID=2621656 RepID=UPI003D7D53C4
MTATIDTATAAPVTTVERGKKYRVIGDTSFHGFATGTIVTGLEANGGGLFLATSRDDWEGLTAADHSVMGGVAYVRPRDLELVVEDAPAPRRDVPATELVPGKKYRVIGDRSYHRFENGTVLTATNVEHGFAGGKRLLTTRADWQAVTRDDHRGGETMWVFPGDVTEEAPSLASLEARRRLAESKLAEFKEQIRERVGHYAEDRDWCGRADEWLEELGLEALNRKKSYTVEVAVTAYVTVEIEEATDEEDARQQAYDELVGSVDFGRTKYLSVHPDYEITDVEEND